MAPYPWCILTITCSNHARVFLPLSPFLRRQCHLLRLQAPQRSHLQGQEAGRWRNVLMPTHKYTQCRHCNMHFLKNFVWVLLRRNAPQIKPHFLCFEFTLDGTTVFFAGAVNVDDRGSFLRGPCREREGAGLDVVPPPERRAASAAAATSSSERARDSSAGALVLSFCTRFHTHACMHVGRTELRSVVKGVVYCKQQL